MSPEELEPKEGISRRRMIKRIGAGAAIAWTAPILTSVRTPAFAQYPTPCDRNDACGCSTPCFTPIPCGVGDCNCWVHASNPAQCLCQFFVKFCGDFGLCPGGSDAECASGMCCVNTCCGFTCAPACGPSVAAPRRKAGAPTTR